MPYVNISLTRGESTYHCARRPGSSPSTATQRDHNRITLVDHREALPQTTLRPEIKQNRPASEAPFRRAAPIGFAGTIDVWRVPRDALRGSSYRQILPDAQ